MARMNKSTLTLKIMMEGVDALQAAMEAQKASWETVKASLEMLHAVNYDGVQAVAKWIADNAPAKATGPGKGRVPPTTGETRTYKAQQVKGASGLFVRLPVDLLVGAKGEPVTVVFAEGVLTVRAKDEAPKAAAPKVEAPKVEAPKAATPKGEAPTEEPEEVSYTPEDLLNFERPKTRIRKRA